MQAWEAISQGSQDLLLLIVTTTADGNTVLHDQIQRAFWVTYSFENELCACLELPQSGLRTLQEKVPLPIGSNDDSGLFFLLGLSSFRKVTTEVLDTGGWASGSAIYAPRIALELRKQLDEWHEHLPARLKFDLDESDMFDPLISYLRSQYYALTSFISWPFVLRALKSGTVADSSCT